VIGAAPQDRSYDGEATELRIGDGNEFREQVTVHRGTARGGAVTVIGSQCLLMVGAHVAHDCVVGDRVTLANGTSLGGHVRVEDRVTCGGHVAVAPFVTLGFACFVAGGAMVESDVAPFTMAAGDRARPRGLNRVGLRRAEVPASSCRLLIRAYRRLYASGVPVLPAARQLLEESDDEHVRRLAQFVLDRAGTRPRSPR
jgi:UDP-N-acetylglucosamine acyltransferase